MLLAAVVTKCAEVLPEDPCRGDRTRAASAPSRDDRHLLRGGAATRALAVATEFVLMRQLGPPRWCRFALRASRRAAMLLPPSGPSPCCAVVASRLGSCPEKLGRE